MQHDDAIPEFQKSSINGRSNPVIASPLLTYSTASSQSFSQPVKPLSNHSFPTSRFKDGHARLVTGSNGSSQVYEFDVHFDLVSSLDPGYYVIVREGLDRSEWTAMKSGYWDIAGLMRPGNSYLVFRNSPVQDAFVSIEATPDDITTFTGLEIRLNNTAGRVRLRRINLHGTNTSSNVDWVRPHVIVASDPLADYSKEIRDDAQNPYREDTSGARHLRNGHGLVKLTTYRNLRPHYPIAYHNRHEFVVAMPDRQRGQVIGLDRILFAPATPENQEANSFGFLANAVKMLVPFR